MSHNDEELMTHSFEKDLVETNSIGRNTQVSESDQLAQSNETGAEEVGTAVVDHLTTRIDSLKESDGKLFKKADSSQQQLFDDMLVDELADFDENTDPVSTQENSASRRRLRMVIDFDDDDE
ncbi:hypothetical protein DH2020_031134 [Rehmannia glutinosa]|uniref:Uncharacterized protein n=1 Tax=Rehmannia glutinosa TaxID=99300 RepID=A0ABR0VIX4_REHGL